jgi:hypothetical protein
MEGVRSAARVGIACDCAPGVGRMRGTAGAPSGAMKLGLDLERAGASCGHQKADQILKREEAWRTGEIDEGTRRADYSVKRNF